MATSDFEQLLEVVDKLTNRISQLKTEMQNLSQTQAIDNRVAERLQNQINLINHYTEALASARTELVRLQAQQQGANYIPGGAPAGGATDVNAGFRGARINPQVVQSATRITQDSLPGFGVNPVSSSTIPTSQNPWNSFKGKIAEKELEDALTRNLSEREKIERARLQAAKSMLLSEERYKAVLQMAEKQGFGIEDVRAVRTRGTGGIQQVQFQKYNQLGVKENLDIFSTPSGRATAGISNQFRTFGQGVVRDIGELTKWSLALAAIYGPLRKLGDLTQEMITNQTKLADATISVNNAFTGQAEIFNVSADAANRSGEAISGVIDAFTQAYRATGGVGDNVTRLSTAQKLLSDSLILSKLSTLDQAQAIDTLSAAMRQTFGQDLTKGTELLDKWVRVTKVANVDLATLATGFATVGDAAGNVGLNIDELNGVLAVLAESTNQTGQEVANTSRAIIAGFQSDQGVQALESLGIATKDAAGNMRSLKDVIQEVASLRNQKLIDDTQFSKLTLAIGGGTRRQAAVATFLENYKRAIAVANQSAQANGDAQAALDKQLATVQTDLTKLANSFTSLAQTMGGEGGFLSIIQGGVKSMTSLVGVFDKLVSLLGKATPAMAAFIASTLVLKNQGIPSIQSWVGSLATTTPVPTGPGGQQYLPGFGPQLTRGQKFGNFTSQNILGTNALSGVFQGLMLSALPAILNATNKDDRYGRTKAGADILGGVGGGVIGALVAGSPIVGAAIGTAISEAFVNATVARKTDIFGYQGAATLLEPGKSPTGGGTSPEDRLRLAEQNLYKSVGFGSEGFGKFLTTDVQKRQEAVFTNLNKAIQDRDAQTFEKLLKGYGGSAKAITGLSTEQLRGAFANNQQLTPNTQIAAYNRASDDARREYDKALAEYKATQTSGTQSIDTPFTKQVAANQASLKDLISQIKESSRGQLQQQRLAGDVTGAEFARKTTALGGFDTKALQYYTAFGKEFQSMNKDIHDTTDAFNAFNLVITSGAEESVPELTAITGEIEKLYNILNDPTLQNKDSLETFGFKNLDEVRKKLEDLRQTGAATVSDIYNQTRLSQLKIPNVQGDINKPLSSKEYGLVSQTAVQLQNQFYQGFLKIPNQMYEGLKKSWESWAQIIKDSGNIFYEKVTGIDPQFFQQAMQQLIEQGKLASQQTTPFGIQQLDITSKQGAGLQGSIDYFSKYLSQNFPQYQQKPEEFGVIFSDYVTNVLHGDNLAVKLALEKLVDINQKQLDGMYNIPEGATFWVPLTAAYYKPKNEGGGAPSLQGVGENTNATQLNTQAVSELTRATYESLEEMRLGRHYEPTKAGGGEHFQRIQGRVQNIRIDEGVQPPDRRYDDLENLRLKRGTPDAIIPGGSSTFKDTGGAMESLRQAIINGLSSLTQALTNRIGPGSVYGENAVRGSVGGRDMTNMAPTVSARLDFRIDNSTQLIVDGRVLASIVTPYLASDLVKLEASQGTITKRYVI